MSCSRGELGRSAARARARVVGSGRERRGNYRLALVVLLGFLRLATNSRVFPRPLAPDAAAAKVDTWLAQDNIRIVSEKDDHWGRLKTLLHHSGTAGNLTTDAHLATLALTNDAVLVSCDADFTRLGAALGESAQ